MTTDSTASRGTVGLAWIAPLALLICALGFFSINLERPPHPDELHHILAAERLIESGRPQIAEGEYERALMYTWLVAVSYELFGDGLTAARLPSVLIVALVIPLMFVWVRRHAGSLAAWLASLLFMVAPFTVEIAQFSRFYAPQTLSFLLASMLIYRCLETGIGSLQRLLLGLIAVLLLALAATLQPTSLLGIVGLATWAFGVVAIRWLCDPKVRSSRKIAAVSAFVILAALATTTMITTGLLDIAWTKYRSTPLFDSDDRNQFWFYHFRFLIFYPTLWPLVGILALAALAGRPRPAWFALTIFTVAFLLNSFAGPKATRYLVYAQPFLAILWGIGLAEVVPSLWRYLIDLRIRLAATFLLPRGSGLAAATVLAVLALLFLLLANPFWLRTATVMANITIPPDKPTTNWRAARETLKPWIDDAEIVLTTEELGALYFLGRYDVRFSPSKLGEIPPDQQFEFGIDHRTGRPVIGEPASVTRLIDCFSSGLIVGPIEHWGSPILISEDVEAAIVGRAEQIDVPKESYLYAWGWRRDPPETRPDHCTALDSFSKRAGL